MTADPDRTVPAGTGGGGKLRGWRTALLAAIARHRRFALSRGIAWGEYDCAMLAADCELAQTGHDPAAPYRGRYQTRAAGLRLVQADGFADYVDVFAARLPGIPVGHARTGDIVVIAGEPGAALGVVEGANIHAYAMRPGGRVEDATFGVAPLLSATRAFRVG